jgi:hypothetical protein
MAINVIDLLYLLTKRILLAAAKPLPILDGVTIGRDGRAMCLNCSKNFSNISKAKRHHFEKHQVSTSVIHLHVRLFGWVVTRDARWYIFEAKLSIWVNFGGPRSGTCWII